MKSKRTEFLPRLVTRAMSSQNPKCPSCQVDLRAPDQPYCHLCGTKQVIAPGTVSTPRPKPEVPKDFIVTPELEARIRYCLFHGRSLLSSNVAMLFLKGTPEKPRCGFSKRAVEALQNENVTFGSFDILEDEQIRQDWPTYPQFYINGELIGGWDILRDMATVLGLALTTQAGELSKLLATLTT